MEEVCVMFIRVVMQQTLCNQENEAGATGQSSQGQKTNFDTERKRANEYSGVLP